MRLAPLIVLAVAGALAHSDLSAADQLSLATPSNETKPSVFVNHKVSTRKVSVNQPVRLEFTTMPRQVEGIEIAASVTNGIALAGSSTWRLSGKPVVVENEKTKTVTVVVTLLPRTTGDLVLPSFPLAWLSGDPRPDFGQVTVTQTMIVGGESRALPPEYDGVGGFLWGARQEDLIGTQIPPTSVTTLGDKTVAKISGSLELGFRAGELAEATLLASGVSLEQSRSSFCERWGVPLTETDVASTWILGWTRITATSLNEPAKPDGTKSEGVRIDLTREDLAAKQAASQVRSRVFNLLEGTPKK